MIKNKTEREQSEPRMWVMIVASRGFLPPSWVPRPRFGTRSRIHHTWARHLPRIHAAEPYPSKATTGAAREKANTMVKKETCIAVGRTGGPGGQAEQKKKKRTRSQSPEGFEDHATAKSPRGAPATSGMNRENEMGKARSFRKELEEQRQLLECWNGLPEDADKL